MKKVKLSNIIKILESGSRPKGGSQESGVISIGGGQVSPNGEFNFSKKVFVPKPFYNKLKKGKIEKGDILIVKDGATTGKIGYVSDDFPYREAAINEHVFRVVIDKEIANSKYVFYYLFSPHGQLEIQKDFRGATIGGITRKFIDKVKVPLPDLQTQLKIVAALDKANRLLQKREESLKLLDELLRAQFLEMFGDPVLNPKKWEVLSLPEISTILRDGPFGSNLKTEHYRETGIRVIRLKNIGVNKFLDKDKVFISEKHYLSVLTKHTCLPGDILIGTLGKPNLRACLLPKSIDKAVNKADCVQLRVNEKKALPKFIVRLLNHPGCLFLAKNYIKGQTRSRISKGMLGKIYVPIPPIDIQKQFEVIYSNLLSSIKQQEESKTQLQHLFNSILQRAFNGQLNFNVDIELDALIAAIDTLKEENDLTGISSDIAYLQRLVDRINEQDFENGSQYQKAKYATFQLLKEGKVKQIYETSKESVKLELT